MENIKYKDIPFKYPDPCSCDMRFSIFVEWDKITIESIIDRCRWWQRTTAYIKMKWSQLWLKTIDSEHMDDYACNNWLWFKKYYTVRNWIWVNETPRYKYDEFWQLDTWYEENEDAKKREGKVESWHIPWRFLDDHAMTYLIIKTQWKEKAEKYAKRIIKKLYTEKLKQYNDEVRILCEKNWAKRWYQEHNGEFWYDFQDFSEKERDKIDKWIYKIGQKYWLDTYDANFVLGMIDEIKQVIEYWNLKFFLKQKKSESFEEMAKDYAEYEKKRIREEKKKNIFNPD